MSSKNWKPDRLPPQPLQEAAREQLQLSALAAAVKTLPEAQPLTDIALARTWQRLRREKPPRRSLWLGYRMAPALAILLLGTTVGASVALVAVKLAAPTRDTEEDTARPGERGEAPRRARRRKSAGRPMENAPAPEQAAEAPLAAGAEPAAAAVAPAVVPPVVVAPVVVAPVATPVVVVPALPPPADSAIVPAFRHKRSLAMAPTRLTGAAPRAPESARADLAPDRLAAAPVGSLSGEASVIATALADLRRNGHAPAALAALDHYLENYPAGVFRDEAALARAEALLALGHRDLALAALQRLGTRRPELTAAANLLRAEITSAARCQDAIVLFTEILVAPGTRPGDQARALHGRAMSRLRCGDDTGARSDLKAYLDRFPDGAHAPSVARRLTGQR